MSTKNQNGATARHRPLETCALHRSDDAHRVQPATGLQKNVVLQHDPQKLLKPNARKNIPPIPTNHNRVIIGGRIHPARGFMPANRQLNFTPLRLSVLTLPPRLGPLLT